MNVWDAKKLCALGDEDNSLKRMLADPVLDGVGLKVLATLRRSNKVNALKPSNLIESMMITLGTTTNRIDRFVSQGLVERKSDEQEARKNWVYFTPEGRTKVDGVILDHAQTQKDLLAGLSNKETLLLNTLLRQIIATQSELSTKNQ